MRRSFRLRALMTMRLAAILLAAALVGCSRKEPEPQPVLSTWAEQAAAAERGVEDKGREFMLADIQAVPLRDKESAPGEPLELRLYLFFVSQKESQLADESVPHHDGRMVKFNDHRLATTLKVEDIRRSVKDETLPGGLGAVRVGPQDVLKTTRSEGEAYMGKPVDRGNILLGLSRASEVAPELKAPVVWHITYYRKSDERLDFMIDPQTGSILKRAVEETKQGRTEADTSPGPKP